MKTLRVGVIGLGVGEQHALGFARTEGCKVVALCDLSAEKLEKVGARVPKARATGQPDDVLDDPDIDVVSLASYDDAHAGQVLKALRAGKHVFVEKPLCRTPDELRAIKEAWGRHGGKVKLTSNLVLRATPLYRWLRRRLAAGDFGEVYAFDGDYLYGRLHKITDGWRRDVPDYSVVAGGGVHMIDLLVWLTGQRPSAVRAVGNRVCTRDTAFHYDDYAAVTMEFPSGMIARVTANFGCVHRHQHVMRVFGTRGTFLYDDAGPRCHASRDPALAAAPVALPTLPASKADLIPDFVRAVLDDEDLGAETQSHFDVLSVVAACDAARHTHSTTEVAYV